MASKTSNCLCRSGVRLLVSLMLLFCCSTTVQGATISSVEITESSCPHRFKIRIEGTFNDDDSFSGYDFFRTRIFDKDNILIHECPCGVEVGGTVFGPFAFWYLFIPPPNRNPLRIEIYEDDDQQLPFGDLLKVRYLDYGCLPLTYPILLDGFESGNTSAWSSTVP